MGIRVFLSLVVMTAGAAAGDPKMQASAGTRRGEAEFRISWKDAFAPKARTRLALGPQALPPLKRGAAPEATVEVWGHASLAREEEMRQFVRMHAPSFRNAFDAGTGASIASEHLAQLVALAANPNQNPAPAICPSVWYNSQDPWARDPKFRRK